MEIISEELRLVEDSLRNLFLQNNDVLKELNKFLLSSSKRIRSKLCILYLKSNNVDIDENIINLLSAGEIMHNASLLHDDVIDESEIRRGEKTIGNNFNNKTSILCGDLLVSIAVTNLIKVKSDNVLNNFIDCTKKMSLAEISQYLLRDKVPSSKEYIDICAGKTSSLFSAILKSAAHICGLDCENADILGKNFGILFQIKNDLLKHSASNDKKNGVHTALDVFGIEKTNHLIDNYKEELLSLIRKYPENIYRRGLEDLVKEI